MKLEFLLSFAILAACASIGSALQCFECSPLSELSNPHLCDDPFKENNRFIKLCRYGEVCLKQVTPQISVGGQDIPSITVRECAPESFCRNEPTEFQEHCHTCSNELCNSTVRIIPSLSTFIILYIIKLIFL